MVYEQLQLVGVGPRTLTAPTVGDASGGMSCAVERGLAGVLALSGLLVGQVSR